MSVLFGADLHFDHKFMADLRGYGRDNLDVMNEAIVDEWNSIASKNDDVFFLGDFSFANAERTRMFFNRLNGKKHLWEGNHDPNHVKRLPWESVNVLSKRSVEGQTLWLCHYPMMTWANAHHGTWHLHGHSHGNGQWANSTRLDVGMDATGKVLISFEEVAEIMATRKYDYCDHHKEGEH